MRLSQLDARFIQRCFEPDTWVIQHDNGVQEQVSGLREVWRTVDGLAEAHGIRFLCPKCFLASQGKVGVHQVVCWFVGCVSDDAMPKPGRWIPAGSGLGDLTFIGPAAVSVAILGGCHAHFYVRNGSIEWA